MNTMPVLSASRCSAPVALVVAVAMTVPLPTLLSGCGPSDTGIDKSVEYTPESLAGELALRFRALSPAAQVAKRARNAKAEKGRTERLARAEQAKNKVTGGAPAKKKRVGPATLDDLLDDVENKLDLITGMSRSDVCRKMVETISADPSLAEAEKQRLKELVSGMAENR